MRIKLVTDASSLLPLKLMKEENIGFLESLLVIEGKEYRELTELDRTEFIESLHDKDPYPTSSQVLPQDAVEVFNQAVAEGYDEVLYLGLTPVISSQMNVVRLAARPFEKKIKITHYPTELAVGPQGAMVYNALKLLKKDKSVEEITSYCDGIKHDIYSIGVTIDVESLFKSGKVKRGSAKGILVSLLKMKPIAHFTIEEGMIGIGAGLSYKSAIQKMIIEIKKRTNPKLTYDLFMCDALNPDLVKDYEKEIKKVIKINETHYWEMSPVMALSSGKGAVMATLCPALKE
ncbi:MAG: DegV family protein [Candidatus Thorarchaeota archaeon]